MYEKEALLAFMADFDAKTKGVARAMVGYN